MVPFERPQLGVLEGVPEGHERLSAAVGQSIKMGLFDFSLPPSSRTSEPMKVLLGDEATDHIVGEDVERQTLGLELSSSISLEDRPTLGFQPQGVPPGLTKITLQEALFGAKEPRPMKKESLHEALFGVVDPSPSCPMIADAGAIQPAQSNSDPGVCGLSGKPVLGDIPHTTDSKDDYAAQSTVQLRLLNALFADPVKDNPGGQDFSKHLSAHATEAREKMLTLDLHATLFPKGSTGANTEEVPIPYGLLRAAVEDGKLDTDLIGPSCPSVGSFGHPNSCAMPCKYNGKQAGCKDGELCTRCHLCKWNYRVKNRYGRFAQF